MLVGQAVLKRGSQVDADGTTAEPLLLSGTTGCKPRDLRECKRADVESLPLPCCQPRERERAAQAFDSVYLNKGAGQFITMLEAYVGPNAFRDGGANQCASTVWPIQWDGELWREIRPCGRPVPRSSTISRARRACAGAIEASREGSRGWWRTFD